MKPLRVVVQCDEYPYVRGTLEHSGWHAEMGGGRWQQSIGQSLRQTPLRWVLEKLTLTLPASLFFFQIFFENLTTLLLIWKFPNFTHLPVSLPHFLLSFLQHPPQQEKIFKCQIQTKPRTNQTKQNQTTITKKPLYFSFFPTSPIPLHSSWSHWRHQLALLSNLLY